MLEHGPGSEARRAARGGPAGACAGCGEARVLGAADWLLLAAAPTFAVMALVTGAFGGGRADVLCSAAHEGSPLAGMAAMYVLMSVFHSAPWLRLIFGRRSGALVRRKDPE